jgi:hypothetical protein
MTGISCDAAQATKISSFAKWGKGGNNISIPVETFFRDNINLSSQQSFEVEDHSTKIEQAPALLKIDQKVDITVRPFCFFANRTENAGVMDAVLVSDFENLATALFQNGFE